MSKQNDREDRYPHSLDVKERETADGGFSRGWGMHFKPVEQCIVDMHGHMQFDSFENAPAHAMRHMALVRPLNITGCAACSPIMATPQYLDEPQGFAVPCRTGMDALTPYFNVVQKTAGLSLMLFLHYANPDVEMLKRSLGEGACAVKLHNAPMIVNAADPNGWLSNEWEALFCEMERRGVPVLWHVTQRLTDSPYTDGGRNTYWKDGWRRGASFTNEDLLQVYLEVARRHPGIPFISAHQLHLGWQRLDSLFGEHPNLYCDTSIGCVVHEGDRMYEHDMRCIRDVFIRHSNRLLFGTDYYITDAAGGTILAEGEKLTVIKDHIRFIRQLELPDDALQRVFHGNARRLLRLL